MSRNRNKNRPKGRDGRQGADRSPERRGPDHRPQAAPARGGEYWIYGFHAAAAALANPERKIVRAVATAETRARLADSGVDARLVGQIHTVSRDAIDSLLGEGAVHQGVAIQVRPLDHAWEQVLEIAAASPAACVVVLDQVSDPQNIGGILRSAAAFGASAVIAQDRHSPEETGALAKAASGALETVPYLKAPNLARALERLKELRFWTVGLDASAPRALADIDLTGRIALVLGAEGEGLRRLVRDTCDHLARLPMPGTMESLNVSAAATVSMYEKARQSTAKKS